MNPRQDLLDALVAERFGPPVRDFGPVGGPQYDVMVQEAQERLAQQEAEEAAAELERRRKARDEAEVAGRAERARAVL